MGDWIDLIIAKRDNQELDSESLCQFVEAMMRDDVPSEQAAAFLMAAVLNDLNETEIIDWTRALMKSGQVVQFNDFSYPTVDILDIGSLGNNAALVALPIAAAYDVKIPCLGERSLGLRGGLLDKLEAIPGFRTDIGLSEFQESVRNCGISVIGQTTETAPADTRINQLRVQTGTMEGVGLNLASLLSHKGVAGARSLVVQVGCGSASVAGDLNQAHLYSDRIMNVGSKLGFDVAGWITNQDNILGEAIGDVLEVREAIEVLNNRGPQDLREVAINLAATMLVISRRATGLIQGKEYAETALNKGRALEKFREFIANQGGDTQVVDNPDYLPHAQGHREIRTQRGGYLKAIDGKSLGNALLQLGGSRTKRSDATDHRVGLLVHKKIGDRVEAGEVLVTLHTSEKSKIEPAIEFVEEAFLVSPSACEKPRLIMENFGKIR